MTRNLLLLATLAGCAGDYQMTINQGNFLTFEHAFTDEAAVKVRNRAERTCADRKLAAVRLTNNCSLSKCFTDYQCMDKDEASAIGTAQKAPQR